jgi:hypothetical protein
MPRLSHAAEVRRSRGVGVRHQIAELLSSQPVVRDGAILGRRKVVTLLTVPTLQLVAYRLHILVQDFLH